MNTVKPIESPEEWDPNGHTGQYDTLARAIVLSFRDYKYDTEDMKAEGLEPSAAGTHLEARMITTVLLTAALCEALANTILTHTMLQKQWKRSEGEPTFKKWTALIPRLLKVNPEVITPDTRELLTIVFRIRNSIVHAKPTLFDENSGILRKGNDAPWELLNYDLVTRIVGLPMRLLDSVITDSSPSVFHFLRHTVSENLEYRLNRPRLKYELRQGR